MSGSASPPYTRLSQAHRPRRRPPSPGLLSLLASIAGSSSSATATPLAFLCPSVKYDPLPLAAGPSTVHSRSATKIRNPRVQAKRTVPDRYEQGDDGIWRKVDSYTLYGSTMCKSCVDATASDSTELATPTSTPSTSTTPSSDILDNLPTGWQPTNKEDRTSLILSLSLCLSLVIAFLIFGSLFWRKKIRKKSDLEMRGRSRSRSSRRDDDERVLMVEKEVRRKKRLWARASARWKANAHHSIRQRLGRRQAPTALVSTSQLSHVSPTSPPHSSVSSSAHSSPSPSPTSSRRSSVSSSRSSITVDARPNPATEHPDAVPPSDSTVSVHLPPSSSPPAYRHQSRDIPNEQISATGFAKSPQRSISVSSLPSLSHHRSQSEEPVYSPPAHAAHVATDDKAVLERLTALASSPPGTSSHPNDAPPASSAPVWRDEQLDDFVEEGGENRRGEGQSAQRSYLPPSLPSPSKLPSTSGKALEAYPYSFEQDMIESWEPLQGPSAPPFEEQDRGVFAATAPPIEHVGMEDYASAPPLEYAEEEEGEVVPQDEQGESPADDDERNVSSTELLPRSRSRSSLRQGVT